MPLVAVEELRTEWRPVGLARGQRGKLGGEIWLDFLGLFSGLLGLVESIAGSAERPSTGD